MINIITGVGQSLEDRLRVKRNRQTTPPHTRGYVVICNRILNDKKICTRSEGNKSNQFLMISGGKRLLK